MPKRDPLPAFGTPAVDCVTALDTRLFVQPASGVFRRVQGVLLQIYALFRMLNYLVRYCNMDYILLSAVMPILLLAILVTYDIACQWEINLKERMESFPPEMRIPDHVTIDTGIPKFHAPGHKQSC